MKERTSIYPLVMTAVMAAAIAVVAPFAVPVGPVPVTMCTLMLYLSAYVLEWKRAAGAAAVYILLGMVGMPVFNGFSGGAGVIAGPTGGYIMGYIPLVVISGLAVTFFPKQRGMQCLGMILATAVLYGFGTAWFCIQTGRTVAAALSVCVLPFLPGDFVKIAVALTVGPAIRERLNRAGLCA